ncbi:acetylornithine deacetylase [Vreelandella titanicae]|uniref:acetylornithine deacetylase n=1 Tax=Vreelandella titanicae TaxID=664683 RepID=UPI0016816561|nr:acetylornithine deacetylase [Halomonas titanicae]QNU64156.1 acetylornithine deacetylase [Halomonas titanicae]
MMQSRLLLEKLVAFETVSRVSNLNLIEFIRGYLDELGVTSQLVYNDSGSKANLWATIGPADRGGIVLSGHTDVVPVEGQAWTFPPFKLTEHDGKLYGRGSADMKGFLACMLAAVPTFLATPLRTPIHLAFSYDEEVGCLGVRSLLEYIKEQAQPPVACIVGEPTGLKPILGHKGKLAMRCHVHGAACHSAYAPDGVNAIEYASHLIVKLTEMGDELRDKQLDYRFDPPFTTVQTGTISGGNALNIVPTDCCFDWEIRTLPSADGEQICSELKQYACQELEPQMRAVKADTGIHFEPLQAYPGLLLDQSAPLAKFIALLANSSDFSTVAFGTEGGLFHQVGIPAVICGPGSMAQGHKPDEFIAIEQLHRCDAMMRRLARFATSEEILK